MQTLAAVAVYSLSPRRHGCLLLIHLTAISRTLSRARPVRTLALIPMLGSLILAAVGCHGAVISVEPDLKVGERSPASSAQRTEPCRSSRQVTLMQRRVRRHVRDDDRRQWRLYDQFLTRAATVLKSSFEMERSSRRGPARRSSTTATWIRDVISEITVGKVAKRGSL